MTLTPEKPVSQKQAGTSEPTTIDSVMGQAQHKLQLSAKTDRYEHIIINSTYIYIYTLLKIVYIYIYVFVVVYIIYICVLLYNYILYDSLFI